MYFRNFGNHMLFSWYIERIFDVYIYGRLEL